MATYAIGDIQGCYDSLRRLLELCAFDPAADRLWLVGDLVNRGPKSLETLRLIKSLGPSALTVLGNHDLYLMMVAEGGAKFRGKDDTLQAFFDAPDCVPN
jgi:bis(5'-nucleosyl)-tetraphosphatase (symmetrical)